MSTLFDTIERATAAGILPVQANETLQEKDSNQPWPAVLLGFIGAQFAVWPILAFIVFSGVGEFIYKGPGSYVVSAIFLVGSLVVLRTTKATGFMGHLAFTALIIGDFLWLFSLTRDLEGNAPLLMMFLVTVSQIALAFLVPDNWTKALLGAASCVAFIITYAIFSKYDEHSARSIWWFISSMTAAALWAALVITEPRWAGRRFAATLSSLATGWGFAVLVAAALGSSEFFARSWSYLGAGASTSSVSFVYTLTANLPFLLTAASGAALLWFWRTSLAPSGRWLLALAFVALTALAWFVPNVAAVAIALAAALLTQRHRMAAFAVLVLLYLLGQFYYTLSMTLVDKAQLVMLTGTALLIGTTIISYAFRKPALTATLGAAPSPAWKLAIPLIALGALLTFGAANYNIWQKERVIFQGQKLYVALAPRDPRSLMQGDYMALNFGLPGEVIEALGGDRRWWRDEEELVNKPFSRRATVVAKVDAKNIATVLRVATGNEVLAAGEVLLPVQFKGGNWALVTDAFFFPEGAGKSLEGAKFGELRALGNGQALLVGLADENLKQLESLPDVEFDKERAARGVLAPGPGAVNSVAPPAPVERMELTEPAPTAKKSGVK